MGVGQIPPDLLHPCLVRIGRAADKVYAARGQVHCEEQVECDQSLLRPDLDRSEVNGTQHIPMGTEECLPGCLPAALRSRLDPMSLQDVADGCVRDDVPQVGQSTLDAIVTPGWILTGYSEYKINCALGSGGPSDFRTPVTVVPLLGDELPVPAQDRVGRDD